MTPIDLGVRNWGSGDTLLRGLAAGMVLVQGLMLMFESLGLWIPGRNVWDLGVLDKPRRAGRDETPGDTT